VSTLTQALVFTTLHYQVMLSLRQILYTRAVDEADKLISAFKTTWNNEAPDFVDYLEKYYMNDEADRRRWMFCYRENVPHAWMHTNNFIESWHNALKMHFFRDKSQRRVDTVIFILVHRALPHYQNTWVRFQVQVGKMTPGQKRALEERIRAINFRDQELANDPATILLKEPEDDETTLHVRSFIDPSVFYDVKVDWSARSGLGLFTSCSCPAFDCSKSCCKHIALALVEFPGTKFTSGGHQWGCGGKVEDGEEEEEDTMELGVQSTTIENASIDEATEIVDDMAQILKSADRLYEISNSSEVIAKLEEALALLKANTAIAPEELNKKRQRQRTNYGPYGPRKRNK
jgi:hypothetical protein